MLYHLLTNPITIGRIRHRRTDYPGQHRAILPPGLWARVEERLMAAGGRKRQGRGQAGGTSGNGARLTGKLRDETGDRLTPTRTLRQGRHYRYQSRTGSLPSSPRW